MPKILIADDSRFRVNLLRTEQEGKGFEVVAAEDAMQAGMFTVRAAPDAIILDLSMPGGSGIEVLKRLKRSTKTRGIPVVIVTGGSNPDLRQVAERLSVCLTFSRNRSISMNSRKRCPIWLLWVTEPETPATFCRAS